MSSHRTLFYGRLTACICTFLLEIDAPIFKRSGILGLRVFGFILFILGKYSSYVLFIGVFGVKCLFLLVGLRGVLVQHTFKLLLVIWLSLPQHSKDDWFRFSFPKLTFHFRIIESLFSLQRIGTLCQSVNYAVQFDGMSRKYFEFLVQSFPFILSNQCQFAQIDAVASLDEALSVLLQTCCSE